MRSLIDFFNHGVLPFIGREAEAERIIRFWRGAAESHGLRAALVMGEAGAGKSRLIEEASPSVAAGGGLVIAAKLYPGATTSIAPLIAQAIWFSGTGRQILRKEPEETIPAVTMALARLARLRATLLVIEDIHLLGGDSLAEFATLLDGLADEGIALLCAARPVELRARGVLERYLVEEITLKPLDSRALSRLWYDLFGSSPDDDVVQAIHQATLGNPLALRSALRGVLKSEALEQQTDNTSDLWQLRVSGQELQSILQRNIRYLSEGMAAYLAEDERAAAEQLACLGEVFARESASVLLDDADRMLQHLTFRGIIAPSGRAAALPGGTSAHPLLAFTHTLLHHYLSERAEPSIGGLLRVIGEGLPLYSIVPFQTIAEHAGAPDATLDEMCRAVDRAMSVAYTLDRTPDWELAHQVLRTAELLADYCREHQSIEEQRRMEIRLIDCRLALMRREEHSEEFLTQLDRLLELTDNPLPADLLHHRITALRHLFRSVRRRDVHQSRRIWDEVDTIIEAHPALQYDRAYIEFLQIAALATITESDHEMISRAEQSMKVVLASPDLSDDMRRFAMREVMPQFLGQFSSREELADRRKLLSDIEQYVDENDMTFRTRKLALLEGLGEVFEALEVIDDTLPRLRARGLLKHVGQVMLIRISAIGLIGTDLVELEATARQICTEAPAAIRPQMWRRAAGRLVQIGLLRGADAWTRHIVETFLDSSRQLPSTEQLLLAAVEGRHEETLRQLIDDAMLLQPTTGLAALVLDPAAEFPQEQISQMQQLLREPVLSRGELLHIRVVADIIMALGNSERDQQVRTALDPALYDAFINALNWLADRSLFSAILPFLERYGWLFSTHEQEQWRKRATEIEERTQRQQAPETGGSLRLSMLGTIEAQLPSGEINPMRGVRLRTLAGLLTLNQLVDKPFSYREFCRLAASGEDDPDKARKVMNMGVLRLREAIGGDAIRTDEESPRFNLDHVSVDLIDASRLLDEAMTASRAGALMRSVAALVEALDIIAGQVPFPGLYDDVFEAARQDFDARLRSAIIEISRTLLREGDAASAEEILRRGFEAMPDDEEMGELLRQTLIQQGKRVEAERVKLRIEEEA